jgi:hypothetical protein
MDKALPPIDHKEDVEEYQAFHESKPVEFKGCSHSQIEFSKDKHELRCKCGAAYTGERLGELYQTLTKSA